MGSVNARLRGEAEAEIFGVFPEAAVNRCAAAGIRLRRVYTVDGQTLRCTLDEADLEKLRTICGRCQCELRLLRIRGGSRDRRFLRRRIWLPMTALVTAAALLVSSLFVWDVEIVGAKNLSRGRILRALSDAGLEQGCFWVGLPAELIRSRALLELPELAWLGVNISGSRAVVLVQERAEKPEIYEESAACDLSASRSGIVRRVSALNGRTLVRPGQAVQEGEVLVGGVLGSITGTERTVRARGEVWAETWYELTAVCPPADCEKGDILWKSRRFALQFGKKRINFYGKSRNTLDGYDTIVHEYELGLKGLLALPIRLICISRVRRAPAASEGADAAAMRARLEAYLHESMEGEIVSRSFTDIKRDGAVWVTMRARCLENIAQPQEISEAGESLP